MKRNRETATFPASRIVCLAAGLLLVSGCGPSTGELKGTVTYQGKPLCCGSVFAVASDGTQVPVLIDENGSYTIPKLPAGPVKIGVTSPDPSAPPRPNKLDKVPGITRTPPPKNPKWFSIPDKYADPEKSGITTTIDKSVNEYNIKLD